MMNKVFFNIIIIIIYVEKTKYLDRDISTALPSIDYAANLNININEYANV
jgi:hypothetical protein